MKFHFFQFGSSEARYEYKYEADIALCTCVIKRSKNLNSQYLIRGFTRNQNTSGGFGVLRDRPQVLYVFRKLGYKIEGGNNQKKIDLAKA